VSSKVGGEVGERRVTQRSEKQRGKLEHILSRIAQDVIPEPA
jgi:hypothetical protein